MKDAKDNVTIDLEHGARRQRGRPVSPDTPTVAERKATSRALKLAAGRRPVTIDLSLEVIAALKKKAAKGETQSQVVERVLRNQLMRAR